MRDHSEFNERLAILGSFSVEETRFWTKVDVRGPDDCWLWLGGVASPDGVYFSGRFSARDAEGVRNVCVASRYAYKSFHGQEPEEQVLHTCDNGLCCNPAHLEDGNQSKNIKDAIRRGRKIMPINVEGRKPALEDHEVRQIRTRAANGETQVSLAAEFSVSKSIICRAVNNSGRYNAYGRVGGP